MYLDHNQDFDESVYVQFSQPTVVNFINIQITFPNVPGADTEYEIDSVTPTVNAYHATTNPNGLKYVTSNYSSAGGYWQIYMVIGISATYAALSTVEVVWAEV